VNATRLIKLLTLLLFGGSVSPLVAQTEINTNELSARLTAIEGSLGQLDAKLSRQLNELTWFQRLADLAIVDKVRFTGPPPQKMGELPTPPGSNDVLISALSFLPRKFSGARKIPLIVLAHGEIHGNVATDEELHVVREMLQQGYAVIAPDYRGSSGYGREFWQMIDYGGQEIEDVHAAREFMLARHPQIDRRRVGIVGWSHGGLISLMTAFAHPGDYQAIYAGVPVSDLVERIKILGPGYEQMFAEPYHIGKTAAEAPEEYRRRSPAYNAAKLATPLLVHVNTSDQDVQFPEALRLLTALNDAGKIFEQRIYTNAPGGHYFNRLDTPLAIESRKEIWSFLDKHLHPPKPVR